MKSYKPEVIADETGRWSGNALRFATYDEALSYLCDLSYRWLVVREIRVVESDDEPNYQLHQPSRFGQVLALVPISPRQFWEESRFAAGDADVSGAEEPPSPKHRFKGFPGPTERSRRQ